jgi:mannosyl-oligosaccharide alpha-1,2-mannosidase
MEYVGAYHGGWTDGRMGHLACFFPGTLALGAKYLNRPEDLEDAKKIMNACVHLYESMPSGIGVDNANWHKELRDGRAYTPVNTLFLLRPETFESLFYLYRMTGDKSWQDKGWRMFVAIEKYCRTEYGYSGLNGVDSTNPSKNNKLER